MKKWYFNLLIFLGLKKSEHKSYFPKSSMHFKHDNSPPAKEIVDEKKLYKELFKEEHK